MRAIVGLLPCGIACVYAPDVEPTVDLDRDGDGLTNGMEILLGSDPDDPDTDGDTYTDRDEDHEGTDLLDPSSVIYQGGWPYFFEKTELTGGLTYGVGERFVNLELEDQFGEVVSLWDFHNEDRYVVLDLDSASCGACVGLSNWITGERDESFAEWQGVGDAVRTEQLYWITVLIDDADAAAWADIYQSPAVPVLADPGGITADYVDLRYFPTLVLLSPDLTVHTRSGDGYAEVLDAALDVLGDEDGA